MKFKLHDVKPKRVADRFVGGKSEKPFNTTITSVKAKAGRGVIEPAICKSSVNTRRINQETLRVKKAHATFVPIPVLVMNDGTARIPRKYQAKYLNQ